jgi:YD repeat-containing protein
VAGKPQQRQQYFGSYQYDLLGDEIDRNLSGNDYVSTYNGAGRLSTFKSKNFNDANNPPNLLTGGTYDAAGHLISATLANGLTESWGYDKRERLQYMAVGTTCSGGNCGTTQYGYSIANSSGTGFAPNGDILFAHDTVNGDWSYTYDDFNRLISASSSAGPCAGMNLSWGYDRYGNRWNQTATGSTTCTASQPQHSFTGNNNRIDTYS